MMSKPILAKLAPRVSKELEQIAETLSAVQLKLGRAHDAVQSIVDGAERSEAIAELVADAVLAQIDIVERSESRLRELARVES